MSVNEGDGVRYFATASGRERVIEFGNGAVRLDGEPLSARISTLPGSNRHHLRMDGRSLSLFARRDDGGWLVELEGRAFEVRVEDERARHVRELAAHSVSPESERELRAPMPGLVVRVEVTEGQTVEAGDGLLVMEAMKMENELRADFAGRVVAVSVTAGQAVERDALLLRIERDPS